MAGTPLERLIRIRQFPPVVHPRHARELLATQNAEQLAEWTAGYAITLPEHRMLLEDLLASLAWGETGKAALVNGAYGTGKSHLLVLLHLLSALPAAWTPFLQAHPTFRRYAKSLQEHRRLLVHFSLDEYGPQRRVEGAIGEEVARTLVRAGIPEMAGWTSRGPRPSAWAELLESLTDHGYDGLVLLVDELSLFLAGKSPSRREGDAAFLQFLAGWSARTPVWLVGALQRNLADVGALRTHSWRQVEDRFQRYTLSPQEIGRVLHDKLVQRTDLPTIRQLIATSIIPAAEAHNLEIPAAEFQVNWPFHPRAIDLLMAVANGYLSPHRSTVEILQQIGHPSWLQHQADHLITPLDLFGLVAADLLGDESLERLWHVVNQLATWANKASDPQLARQLLDLLSLLHLAERTASVAQLQELLFDGINIPPLSEISHALHHLRRYGAYLAVIRDADPAAEVFRLEIDDDVGALATMRMQEMRHEFTLHDARVTELAYAACTGQSWPLAAASTDQVRLSVPWCAAERHVLLSVVTTLSRDAVVRLYEGLLARHADGHVLMLCPGDSFAVDAWHAATALLSGPATGTLILWLPRALRENEYDLWVEYAAWQRAALEPAACGIPREKRARQRCLERAAELSSAVEASVQRLYLEGRWINARGAEGIPPSFPTCADCLATILAPGFNELFPLFPTFTAHEIPTRSATQQLLTHFIAPGELMLTPQALLSEYIERFALPLGIAAVNDTKASVTPPRWEFLQPVMDLVTAQPTKYADALDTLQHPPVGLTPEQAQLALSAAIRTGALQGLDGFLHPLDPDGFVVDTVSFVTAPLLTDECHRLLVHTLASCWRVSVSAWPLACSQVEQHLRGWVKRWLPCLPDMHDILADWSAALQVLPWAWTGCERQLAVLARLGELRQETFNTLLAVLEEENDGQLPGIELTWEACIWWRAHRTRVALLAGLPPEGEWHRAVAAVCESLAHGESCFAMLSEIDERMTQIWHEYREAYRRWHEEIYGAAVVSGLRQVFDTSEFRAIKALSRLPLPLPTPAAQCLAALAQAKAHYCHGAFAQFDSESVCTQCRLPYGSASPLPHAEFVHSWAVAGVALYAQLLQEHPWVASIRERAARAPEEIAARVNAIFRWCPDEGAAVLVTLLDERILGWLSREGPSAGKRHLRLLQEGLAGHDLTLAEARASLLAWLDPEGELSDESLLEFE